jgi:hypothetical protein
MKGLVIQLWLVPFGFRGDLTSRCGFRHTPISRLFAATLAAVLSPRSFYICKRAIHHHSARPHHGSGHRRRGWCE